MSDHARLSPSARYRWSVCPASVRAISTLPESPSGPSAIDGTHTHSLLEHCLKQGIWDPQTLLGLVLSDHEGKFAVDQERIERAKIALNYISTRYHEIGPGTVIISESRVSPKELFGRDDLDGTVDVQLLNDGFIEIIDYKDGMNPVSPVDNKQLEMYALAVLSERIAKGDFGTRQVRLTIIQPKVAVKGDEPITWVEHSTDTILGMVQTVAQEAAATDAPDAPFVPGEKQCQYCPFAGRCAAHINHALEQSGLKFSPIDSIPQQAATTSAQEMDDARLRELIEAAPMIRKMMEAVEVEALNRIKSGHPIQGLKAIQGPGRRVWKLPEEEIVKKLKGMQVPTSVIYQQSVISAPKMLDGVTWTKRDGTVEQLSERQLKTLTTECVEVSTGKLTVVPIADRRPAVEFPDLSKAFENVDAPSWMS